MPPWGGNKGRAPPAYVASQGTRLGRKGRPRIDLDADGAVWVGGATFTCIDGEIEPWRMSQLGIVEVGPAELACATRLLRRLSDRDLTITDAVGLHEMQVGRGIRTCWSTDRHLG